jgi:hypothetical protein
VLRIYHRDSPASMSIHEEGTKFGLDSDDGGVQQPGALRSAQAQNSLDTIVPDLV